MLPNCADGVWCFGWCFSHTRSYPVCGCAHAGTGVARANNDKQFLFLNGRPVDILKVTKAINEVWRQYEMKHKPAYILDLQLPAGSFDINVTPDKREVFLTKVCLCVALFVWHFCLCDTLCVYVWLF